MSNTQFIVFILIASVYVLFLIHSLRLTRFNIKRDESNENEPNHQVNHRWPLIVDYTHLAISSDRKWSPPKSHNPQFEKYLIYEPQLIEALSTPIIRKVCPVSSSEVIIVKTAIENLPNRDAIRGTWARVAPSLNVSLFFAIGSRTADFNQTNSVLVAEDQLNHDIIQFAFDDTYSNLTLKEIASLSWSISNCPSAKYVITTDDDMYLELDYLIGELGKMSTMDSIFGFFFGDDIFDVDPLKFHSHYVPKEVSDY